MDLAIERAISPSVPSFDKLKSYDGVLLVNKPRGMTSKDVSRWFQRRLGKIKIGHVGTLDPMAEGLLPIVLGKATRLQDFLVLSSKEYEFDLTFGIATDTLDTDGQIIGSNDVVNFEVDSLRSLCKELIGNFEQVPPLYSAIKYNGRPLYDYARKGQSSQVPLEALKKMVRIHNLECLGTSDGIATFRVGCSKGTYVRVLGCRIAELLGTIGAVSRLVRLSSGPLTLDEAWTLDELEGQLTDIAKVLIPIENIPLNIPKFRLTDSELVRRLKMGQEIFLSTSLFQSYLVENSTAFTNITSLDHVVLFDHNGQSFGIGTAIVLTTGQVSVRMRRGLS